MAVKYAVKSGNWSDSTVWNSGTFPGAGDEVHPATFTVTIDQDITVTSLLTSLNGSAAAGGTFAVSSMTTRVINAAIGATASNSTTDILTVSATSGTLTINGACKGGATTTGKSAVLITGAGCTVNINGAIQGGAVATNCGVSVNAAATVNIVGNVTGGSNASAYGVNMSTVSAVVSVTGTILGSTGVALYIGANVSLTIQATSQVQSAGITVAAACTLLCYGTLLATGSNACITNVAAATITCTASITAINGTIAFASTSYTATIVLYGPFIASADGTQPMYAVRYYVKSATPASAYIQKDETANHSPVDYRQSQWDVPTSGLTTAGSIGERLKTAATVATTGDQLAASLDQ